MDNAAKKSFEIQAQVRQNAQAFQTTMKDLYSWEREMKEKEKQLQSTPATTTNGVGIGEPDGLKTLPLRSQIFERSATSKQKQEQVQQKQQQPKKQQQQNAQHKEKTECNDNEKETAVLDEKAESAPDPAAQKLKDANEIKDRGNRHVKFFQYDLAIEEYAAAIEMCPAVSVFYTNRAFCYLKLERYEECIADCDRAIELDNLAVKAYYRRMQANESLGNYMDALKDCTTALTIEPRNAETKKSLERINERLRKNQKSQKGPNFSADNENFIEILPYDKPPYKRSSKPLRRVPVADVVGPKDSKTFQNLEISDDDIDKLFNSNCGPFVEVKKKSTNSTATTPQDDSSSNKTLATTISKQTATKVDKQEKHSISTPTIKVGEPKDNIVAPAAQVENTSVDSNKLTQAETEKSLNNKMNKSVEKTQLLIKEHRALPPAPTSTAQFYTHWKELPVTQKYQYLKSIDLKILTKMLGAGFDSDTFTDCLRVLHDYYLPNNEATTAETLLEISRNEQTTILSLLMSTDDRKALLEIVNALKEHSSVTKETLSAITTNFNLN